MTLNTTELKNIIDKRMDKHIKLYKDAKNAFAGSKINELKINCIKDAERDFRYKNDIFNLQNMFDSSVDISEISDYQHGALEYVQYQISYDLV
jgi:hypothetical protein